MDAPQADPPAGAGEIGLLYQPTSWEYVQFLRVANTGQSPFLADEGQNLLDAWFGTGMAAPFVMATATWGGPAAAIFADGFETGDRSRWSPALP